MSPSPHAGQAIAAERKLAGLSQRQLASRVNYSLAMVKAVEQGREPASPAFIAATARVLRVEPERLTGAPYREALAEDGPLEGIAELRAILCEGEYVRAEQPRSIADLRAALRRINDEDRKGNSRKALAQLPALIRETYGALQETADPAAYEVLCSAYNAADRMCRRFGFMSLTIPAIDRYDWAAARSGDPLAPAVGKVMRTRLLVYQDSTDLALTLVDKAIAESPGESEGALSVAGAAHLAGRWRPHAGCGWTPRAITSRRRATSVVGSAMRRGRTKRCSARSTPRFTRSASSWKRAIRGGPPVKAPR